MWSYNYKCKVKDWIDKFNDLHMTLLALLGPSSNRPIRYHYFQKSSTPTTLVTSETQQFSINLIVYSIIVKWGKRRGNTMLKIITIFLLIGLSQCKMCWKECGSDNIIEVSFVNTNTYISICHSHSFDSADIRFIRYLLQ